MVLAWAKLWKFTIEQKVQKKTMFLLIRFQSQRIVQYWNISYSKWGMQVQILQWSLQPFPWKILSGDDINVAKIHYHCFVDYKNDQIPNPLLSFYETLLPTRTSKRPSERTNVVKITLSWNIIHSHKLSTTCQFEWEGDIKTCWIEQNLIAFESSDGHLEVLVGHTDRRKLYRRELGKIGPNSMTNSLAQIMP